MVEMLKLAGALLRPLHLSMGLVVAEAVPETDERQQTGPNTQQHSTGGGGCNVYKTDERIHTGVAADRAEYTAA